MAALGWLLIYLTLALTFAAWVLEALTDEDWGDSPETVTATKLVVGGMVLLWPVSVTYLGWCSLRRAFRDMR